VHYCAAKAALEALAEGYRAELLPLGVDSVILEPGAYGTSFLDNLHRADDAARAASYGAYADAPRRGVEAMRAMVKASGADPQEVADAVARLVEMPFGQRPLRTLVGKDTAHLVSLNEKSEELSRLMQAGAARSRERG